MTLILTNPIRVTEGQPQGCPPMLRVKGDADLYREEVEQLRDALTEWLERR